MSNALKYKAIYKDGVLIPFEKIDLDEGEKVEIEIKKEENKKEYLFPRIMGRVCYKRLGCW